MNGWTEHEFRTRGAISRTLSHGIELTSESIETHIARARRSGAIMLFEPTRMPHEGYRRRLWLHPLVGKWVLGEGSGLDDQVHRADVRAFLKGFVIGEDFDDDVLLKPLKPPHEHLYSLRISFQPQYRIVGGFLRPGEFVAAAHRSRNEIGEDWVPVRTKARSVWATLFPDHNRAPLGRRALVADFEV